MRRAEQAYPGAPLELVERAGSAAADAALRRFPGARAFSVWCGTGNNGGDGFVVARKLHEAGREVSVRLLGPEEKGQGDAAENLRRGGGRGARLPPDSEGAA